MPKKPILSPEDKALLEKAMKGVKPLKSKNKKVHFEKTIPVSNVPKTFLNPELEPQSHSISLTDPQTLDIHAETILSFHKSGLNDRQLKKIRRGEISIEATLDLHQHTIEQARTALCHFLEHSSQQGFRHIRIIHGKGQRDGDYARLKTFVYHWLPQFNVVLAFHSCPPNQGGTGAVNVLLKKQ